MLMILCQLCEDERCYQRFWESLDEREREAQDQWVIILGVLQVTPTQLWWKFSAITSEASDYKFRHRNLPVNTHRLKETALFLALVRLGCFGSWGHQQHIPSSTFSGEVKNYSRRKITETFLKTLTAGRGGERTRWTWGQLQMITMPLPPRGSNPAVRFACVAKDRHPFWGAFAGWGLKKCNSHRNVTLTALFTLIFLMLVEALPIYWMG